MFSSVVSSSSPSKMPPSCDLSCSNTGSIGTTSYRMPSALARPSASSRLPCDEYCDGMATPRTFSGPSASTATAAVTAESIPPLNPMTADAKPHLCR